MAESHIQSIRFPANLHDEIQTATMAGSLPSFSAFVLDACRARLRAPSTPPGRRFLVPVSNQMVLAGKSVCGTLGLGMRNGTSQLMLPLPARGRVVDVIWTGRNGMPFLTRLQTILGASGIPAGGISLDALRLRPDILRNAPYPAIADFHHDGVEWEIYARVDTTGDVNLIGELWFMIEEVAASC